MSNSPSSRSSAFKIIVRTLAILACLVLATVAALPSLLSSQWVKNTLLGWVNKDIPGHIEIGEISLHWSGPQDIRDVTLKDPQGNQIVTLKSAHADVSLFTLIFAPSESRDIDIENLNATLIKDSSGLTNIQRALQKDLAPPLAESKALSFPPIVLKNVNAHVHAANDKLPFTLQLNGSTQQGSLLGNFTVNAQLSHTLAQQVLHKNVKWSDFANNKESPLKLDANVTHMPVELLDQILAYNNPAYTGKLLKLLGPQLDLNITQNTTPKGIALQLKATSDNLNATAEALLDSSFAQGKPSTLNFTADMAFKGAPNPTHIKATATLPPPQEWESLLETMLSKVNLLGSVSGIPLPLLDQWLDLNGLLPTALGSSANIDLTVAPSNSKPIARIRWQSDYLTMNEASFEIGPTIIMQKPTQIQWQLNPAWVNAKFGSESFRLKKPVSAILTFNTLTLPRQALDSSARDTLIQNIDFQADLGMGPVTILTLPTIKAVTINNLVLNASSTKSDGIKLSMTSDVSQPEDLTFLRNVIGDKTKIVLSALVRMAPDTRALRVEDFNFSLDSELTRLQMKGRIHDSEYLVFTAPATLTYQLTSSGLSALGIDTRNLVFEHQSPLELTVEPSSIPFNLGDIEKLEMNGFIKFGDMAIGKHHAGNDVKAEIQQMAAEWEFDGVHQLISLDFSANPRLKQQAAGKVKGNILIDNWLHQKKVDFSKAKVRANASIYKLPIEILNVLLGEQDLLPIVGNALDVNAAADFSPLEKKGLFEINLASPHLKGSATLSLNPQGLHLYPNQTPAEINFVLTPGGYQSLRKWINDDDSPQFIITDSTHAKLKIQDMDLPFLADSFQLDYLKTALDMNLFIDNFNGVNQQTQQKIFLSNIQSHLHSKNIAQNLNFNMQAKGQTGQGISTSWNVVGFLENGLTSKGTLNRQNLSLSLDATISSLPISLLCQFVCINPHTIRQIDAIIGSTMDANLRANIKNMNGPVFANIKGKNGHLMVDGNIAGGLLLLNKDLTMQVNSSPQLSEYVLQEYLPIIKGMLNADQPIKLTIAKERFSLPLQEPSLSNVSVSQGTLELGKVHFASHSELAKVLSLLATSSKDQLVVWLTPLYFSIHNGVIKVERLDMLVNNRFPFAAWGTVDLPNDDVNMIIGLTGASITQAFSVPGISKSYILQIPFRGTLKKADLDKTKAAARLSALVAQAQGSTEGFVLGTVLHIAGGALSENPAPKPTTQPLPWNNLLEDKQEENTSSPKDKPSKNSTVEEIKKGAGSLLKQLLQK